MNDTPILLYPHVGRTGGNSLCSMLDACLPSYAHEYYDLREKLWDKFRYLEKADFKHIQMISGHGVEFGTHRYIQAPCQYVAFLREPVDRVTSQYYAYMSDPTYALHENFKKQNLSLEEYSNRNRNMQARQLLGWHHYFGKEMERWSSSEVFNTIIQRYSYMGINERAYDFLHILGKRLGIKEYRPVEKIRKNKNRKRVDELSEETIETIKSHNQVDTLLFEFAKKKIAIDFDQLSPEEQLASQDHERRTRLYQENKDKIDLETLNHRAIERILFKGSLKIALIDTTNELNLDSETTKKLIDSLNTFPDTDLSVAVSEKVALAPQEPLSLAAATIDIIKKSVDYVVIATDPGKDYIVKESLQGRGFSEEKICFLLNAIPSF